LDVDLIFREEKIHPHKSKKKKIFSKKGEQLSAPKNQKKKENKERKKEKKEEKKTRDWKRGGTVSRSGKAGRKLRIEAKKREKPALATDLKGD